MRMYMLSGLLALLLIAAPASATELWLRCPFEEVAKVTNLDGSVIPPYRRLSLVRFHTEMRTLFARLPLNHSPYNCCPIRGNQSLCFTDIDAATEALLTAALPVGAGCTVVTRNDIRNTEALRQAPRAPRRAEDGTVSHDDDDTTRSVVHPRCAAERLTNLDGMEDEVRDRR